MEAVWVILKAVFGIGEIMEGIRKWRESGKTKRSRKKALSRED